MSPEDQVPVVTPTLPEGLRPEIAPIHETTVALIDLLVEEARLVREHQNDAAAALGERKQALTRHLGALADALILPDPTPEEIAHLEFMDRALHGAAELSARALAEALESFQRIFNRAANQGRKVQQAPVGYGPTGAARVLGAGAAPVAPRTLIKDRKL